MHYFNKREFLVKMWDKKIEDISKDEITEESIQHLKDNLLHLDKHLAPYPYENLKKWKSLTSHITGNIYFNVCEVGMPLLCNDVVVALILQSKS